MLFNVSDCLLSFIASILGPFSCLKTCLNVILHLDVAPPL